MTLLNFPNDLVTTLPTQEPLVVLASLRSRKHNAELVAGIGGIPPGRLMHFDLEPNGGTYLWQRLRDILSEIAAVFQTVPREQRRSARIVLLDLSGSMAARRDALHRMWAAVPHSGVTAQGVEILVVTDGQDNESEPPFKGSNGLLALLREAEQMGWACADSTVPDALGKLYITLLDVGDGSVSRELEMKNRSALLLCTTNLDLVARVMRQPNPPVNREKCHGEADIAEHWPALPAEELQQLQRVERSIGKKGERGLDLEESLSRRLDPIEDAVVRETARKAVLEFLADIVLNNTVRQVQKRGPAKLRFHSEINYMLYELERFDVLECDKKKSPPAWRRGVMHAYIEDQLREGLAGSAELQATEQIEPLIDTLLELPQEQALEQLKRSSVDTQALIAGLLQRAKRVKT